jgi:thymidine kinase
MRNPEFILFTGPMFSGKTTRLLAQIDRYKYQKKRTVAFKPIMDDRYSKTNIKTHIGLTLDDVEVVTVETAKDIYRFLIDSDVDYDVIAVDEAFMIDDVAETLIRLFRLGKTIIVSSLEMSASCKAFDEVAKIMPWATRIEKCPAVCVECQADAFYTQRKVEEGEEIQVGGADLYEPRCWNCHSYTNERDMW